MKKQKLSVYYKYLLSYLLIFAIPLVILSILMYYYSVVSLRKEVEESGISKLYQVNNLMNMRMMELQNIAVRISMDQRLAPYKVKNEGFLTDEIINELGKYKSNSAIIDEILLYFREDSRIYSTRGMHSIDTLMKYVYKYDNWGTEQFLNDIKTANKVNIRPVEKININQTQEYNYLTYLCPIPLGAGYPSGTVLFLVREQVFTDMVKDVLGNHKGSVYILDDKGSIIVSRNTGVPVEINDISDAISQYPATGIYSTKIDRQEYSLMNVTSEDTGWRVVSLIASSQLMARVNAVKNLILGIIAFVALIGVVLTYVLSRSNYRPIRSLTENVRTLWLQDQTESKRNEFDIIQSAMDLAYDSKQNLEFQINLQRPIVRGQMLLKLLRGRIAEDDDITDMCRNLGLQLQGDCYAVMIITLDKLVMTNKRLQDEVFHMLEDFTFQGGEAYGVQLLNEMDQAYSNVTALIICLREKGNSRDILRSIAHTLSKMVREQLQAGPVLGIGKAYDSLPEVKYSFIEAFSAIEFRSSSEEENTFFYDEIAVVDRHKYHFPEKELVALVQSLKQGSATVARDMAGSILKELAGVQLSHSIIRCVNYDIVNTVIKVVSEVDDDAFSTEIRQLMEFSSPKELEDRLYILIDRFCEYVENSKESKNTVLKKDIRDYIDREFRSFDLSLDKVAEHFNISLFYLSRFFKEQTGYNFSEYLINLRQQEAKRLLAETDKPIREVIEEVGYRDASNFARKFRILEGVTPGQYRKLYNISHR